MANIIGIGERNKKEGTDYCLTFRASSELKSSIIQLANLYGIPVVEQSGLKDSFEDLEADDVLPPSMARAVRVLLAEIKKDLRVSSKS